MNPFHINFKHYVPVATKDLSISLGSKNPNIPLNVCKCSTEKTYSTRDIGSQTVRKCYSKSSTLLPDYKKTFMSPSGIEPVTDVLCHNISVAFPTVLCSSYFKDRISHTRTKNTQSVTRSCFLAVRPSLMGMKNLNEMAQIRFVFLGPKI